MQADSKPTGSRVVILEPNWTVGAARVLRETGRAIEARADALTPRPDLPRLEWPGDQKAALEEAPESEEEFMANIEKALDDHYGPLPSPALPDGWRLADHPEDGRVVVTDDTPGLDGWVYGVFASDMDGTGFDWHPYDPGELTYIDTWTVHRIGKENG